MRSPFPVHFDELRRFASDAAVRRGLGDFKDQRVLEIDSSPLAIAATVQGSAPGIVHRVELAISTDGTTLDAHCDCADDEPCCRHAVAAMMEHYARRPLSPDDVESAASAAIEERVQRARTQVHVEHLCGEPSFGSWQAWTTTSGRTPRKPTPERIYTVQLRSLETRTNTCSCPDFALNGLGTCKHIEAVRHRVASDPDAMRRARRFALAGPPRPYVHLAWDVPEPPVPRLVRCATSPDDLDALLDTFFDPGGLFTGTLPDDLYRLQHTLQRRRRTEPDPDDLFAGDELLIGQDVLAHAARLDAARKRDAAVQRERDAIIEAGPALPGLDARLYPYQLQGTAFLAANRRALLADDMGLGKTLQSIAACMWLRHARNVRRTLVVCPASLKGQWARELRRFTDLDDDQIRIVEGTPAARRAIYREGAPFAIVNYELVLRDAQEINELYAADVLVLDEAQRIKNWRTRTAAAIKGLHTEYAFVLSGTPLENRLEELYSVMQVVDDHILGPLWRFMLDYHVRDDRDRIIGYRNLTELRRRLAPVMLRRDRRIVRDQLPDRIEQRRDVPMTAAQREAHDAAQRAAAAVLAERGKRPLDGADSQRLMAALQRARMACNALALVDPDAPDETPPKLEELADLLEELCLDANRKVVVFSEWERMGQLAEALCDKLGIGAVRLHGGVPTDKRGALLERFATDPAAQVFISTDAGGVGLNLQSASVLINLDVPWNPARLAQRIARVHRLGQRESVLVVMLVAEDSYESHVLELLAAKQELFDEVLGEEAGRDRVAIAPGMAELLTGLRSLLPDERRPEGTALPPESEAAVGTPEASGGFDPAPGATRERSEAGKASGARAAAGSEQHATGAPDAGAARHHSAQELDARAVALLGDGFVEEAVSLHCRSRLARVAERTGLAAPHPRVAAAWVVQHTAPAGPIPADEANVLLQALALSNQAAPIAAEVAHALFARSGS